MAQWGKGDSANNSVKWAVDALGKQSGANSAALFANTTTGAFVSGQKVGLYNIDQTEVAALPGASKGWVIKKEGTGGRAGRVTYETLVSFAAGLTSSNIPISPTGAVTLFFGMGDSRIRGQAEDQASLSYTPDANILSYNSARQFVQYNPGVFTGRAFGIDDGNVGPSMQFARAARISDPTHPVFLASNAYPGSLQTGTGTCWNPAAGSSYMPDTISILRAAKADVISRGYTPRIVIAIELGDNDTSIADATKYTYGQNLKDMLTQLKAELSAGDIIIHGRCTYYVQGTFAIRCMQQAKTKNESVVFLSDNDNFTRNVDNLHENLAGIIGMGAQYYAIAAAQNVGLRLPFYSENFTVIDAKNPWPANAGWSQTVGPPGKMVATAVPTFGGTSKGRVPFEVGKQYRIRYNATVSSGQHRFQMLGGTTISGTTYTGPLASFLVDTTTAAVTAGTITFSFAAANAIMSGEFSNLVIDEV